MKLYIWEGDGVLQDWSSGMIAALGNNLEEALAAIRKNCDYGMSSFPNDRPTHVIEITQDTKPVAFTCWGGG